MRVIRAQLGEMLARLSTGDVEEGFDGTTLGRAHRRLRQDGTAHPVFAVHEL